MTYTIDELHKIREQFIESEFYDKSILSRRSYKDILDKVNSHWPNLMKNSRVLSYWIINCHKDNFIDSLLCEHCRCFMYNKFNNYPKYCSKECRLANHNWSKNSDSRKKLETFWEQKYGSKNPLSSKEVRDKIAQTNLEKYGAKHVWSKDSKVWDKIKLTNLDKFGVEYQVQSNNFKEKFKQTSIEHFGVEHPMKSKEVRDKIAQTNLEKYGTTNVWNFDSPIIDKIKQTNIERYGVPYYCMTEDCINSAKTVVSKVNLKVKSYLESLGLQVNLEEHIGKYNYDLYINNTNILIDINPSITHSITRGISHFKAKSVSYHHDRLLNARNFNYRLIQLWDWDDYEKVLQSLFSNKTRVYARNCDICLVDSKTTNVFLKTHHFQGSTKTYSASIGLKYNNELVLLMTFGKSRYNKNFEYELLRLCTHKDFKVVGGASKVLKYFEDNFKPKSIISYCDLSKFSGDTYRKLGFSHAVTSISKHWYNLKTHKHVTDNLLRQFGADRILKENYGKGTNNEELMRLHGYIEIFDAGQATYHKYFDKDIL